MSVGVVEVAVAAMVAVIAFGQWRAVSRQARSEENAVSSSLAQRWSHLGPNWKQACFIAACEDPAVDVTFADLQAMEDYKHLFQQLEHHRLLKMEVWDDPNATAEADAVIREIEAQLEAPKVQAAEVVAFLAEVAGLVLRGRLSPEMAYDVIGRDVAHREAVVRFHLKQQHAPTQRSGLFGGVEDRVLCLMNVLWSEGLRVGDADPWLAERHGMHKRRTKSGFANRARAYTLARNMGRSGTARRLVRVIGHAEMPPAYGPLRRALLSALHLLQVRIP